MYNTKRSFVVLIFTLTEVSTLKVYYYTVKWLITVHVFKYIHNTQLLYNMSNDY